MPLRVDPPLELRRVLEEKAVEKRATIAGDRRLEVAAVQGVLELTDVGSNLGRVESQRLSAQEQLPAREQKRVIQSVVMRSPPRAERSQPNGSRRSRCRQPT